MALTQVAAGLLAGSITSSQISSVSGASLTGTQNIPRGTLPTGSVLQVVTSTATTNTTTTSTSYVTTNLSISITPLYATSKVLVLHQGMINTQGSGYWCFYTLYRGGTNLYASGSQGAAGGIYINGGVDNHSPSSIVCLDSPATTSSTTYTIYVKSNNGASVRYNADGWVTNMVALEIAA